MNKRSHTLYFFFFHNAGMAACQWGDMEPASAGLESNAMIGGGYCKVRECVLGFFYWQLIPISGPRFGTSRAEHIAESPKGSGMSTLVRQLVCKRKEENFSTPG